MVVIFNVEIISIVYRLKVVAMLIKIATMDLMKRIVHLVRVLRLSPVYTRVNVWILDAFVMEFPIVSMEPMNRIVRSVVNQANTLV